MITEQGEAQGGVSNERIESPPESFGWEDVHLTESEMDALVDYADAGMVREASEVVDGAYARLFGEAIQ